MPSAPVQRRGGCGFLLALLAVQCFHIVFSARVRRSDSLEARNGDVVHDSGRVEVAEVTRGSELVEVSEAAIVASPEEPEVNEDMMLCKRQNLFDLAVPYQKEHLVRVAFGWGGTTDNDVYISATSVFIEQLKARIQVYRSGARSFVFEIIGWKGQDAATAEFEIGGVQVLSRSTLVNVGKGILGAIGVADFKTLAETQKGSVRMNLAGEAMAVQDEATGEWKMQLVSKAKREFEFTITGQYVLEKALNSEMADLDTKIVEGIFGGITEQLLSPALATAFSALPASEANTRIIIDINGGMQRRGGPLKVHAEASLNFNVQPGQLFKYWTDNFDLEAMAVKKVDEFLERDDVQESWRTDRQAFADNLRRYGFGVLLNNLKKKAASSDSLPSVDRPDSSGSMDEVEAAKLEVLEKVMNGGTLEELRPFLHETARKTASFILRIFEPYMKAYTVGEGGIFDGLLVQTDVWARYGDDNRVRAGATVEGGEEKKTILNLPGKLMAIMGLDNVLALPRANQTTSQVDFDVEFKGTNFKVKRTQLTDFRLRTGGGVDAEGKEIPRKTFKMNGRASDVSLTIPSSWDQGLDLTCDNAGLEVTPQGVAIELKEGFAFTGAVFDKNTVEPPKILGSDHIRRGDTSKIDGPLKTSKNEAVDYLPPTRDMTPATIDDLLPAWDAGVNFAMTGSDSKIDTTIAFEGSVDLGLLGMLKGIMATRDAFDHGYPFGVAKVKRYTSGSYSLPNDRYYDSMAMVSCGTISLIQPEILRDSDPWKRMDFNPSKGQLELDITEYDGMPDLMPPDGDRESWCLHLTSNGQKPWTESGRMGFGTYTVHEYICGDKATLAKVMDPLKLQIERFRDSRARAWRYGTHDVNKDKQFILGGGRETAPLLQFLRDIDR